MQVVTLLMVLLVSTIVSSTKCKNPKLPCIELCCEETQFFHTLLLCTDIPEQFKASWLSFLHNKTLSETMEVVEYGECEPSIIRQVYIDYCYSPFHNATINKFVFKKMSNIPCNRLVQTTGIHLEIVAIVFYCSLPICLPIMMVYTCRKGLKDKFTYKLVSWYLVSMAGYFAALFLNGFHILLKKQLEADVADIHDMMTAFFLHATYLWQNVIGFQIWSAFKGQNLDNNVHKDERRCLWYSLFVWGIPAILLGVPFVLPKKQLTMLPAIIYAVPCFNLLAYISLSLNICITRCRVINLTDEVHFKRKLAILILRLGLVMGIPRMLIASFRLFYDISRIVFTLYIILEPYAVFTVLVWKPKGCFRCKFGCDCCRKADETSNTAEVVYLNSSRD